MSDLNVEIQPDFTKDSNMSVNVGASQVKTGADAPLLEVEVNELQQIQNLAREDLIRATIPSGFTKPIEIDFDSVVWSATDANKLATANDAEAYVNGMRIFIPKGTVIDLGDAPVDKVREDLIILEVWKEEVGATSKLNKYGGESQPEVPNYLEDGRVGVETSHRIINKWRLRCIQDIDFETHPKGLRTCGEVWDNIKGIAQGGNAEPIMCEDPSIKYNCNYYSIFIDYPDSPDWVHVYNMYLPDYSLAVAGKYKSDIFIKHLKSVDGLCFALPVARVQRQPNTGIFLGDYNKIHPLVDTSKLDAILSQERVAGVDTGDVELEVKGRTLKNLIPRLTNFKVVSGSLTNCDANLNTELLKTNTKYYFKLFDYSEKVGSCYLGDGLSTLTLVSSTNYTNLSSGAYFVTANSLKHINLMPHFYPKEGQSLTIEDIQNIKAVLVEVPKDFEGVPYHFEGMKSVAEDSLRLQEINNLKITRTTTEGDGYSVITSELQDPFHTQVELIDNDGNVLRPIDTFIALDKYKAPIMGVTFDKGRIDISNPETYNLAKSIKYIGLKKNYVPITPIKQVRVFSGLSLVLKGVNEIGTKESIKEFDLMGEPLRSCGDYTDTIIDNVLVRRIKNIRLSKFNTEMLSRVVITNCPTKTNTVLVEITGCGSKGDLALCDKLASYTGDYLWMNDVEGIGLNRNKGSIYVRVTKSKLGLGASPTDTEIVNAFKAWFNNVANYLDINYPIASCIPVLRSVNNVSDYDDRKGIVTRNFNSQTSFIVSDVRSGEGYTDFYRLMLSLDQDPLVNRDSNTLAIEVALSGVGVISYSYNSNPSTHIYVEDRNLFIFVPKTLGDLSTVSKAQEYITGKLQVIYTPKVIGTEKYESSLLVTKGDLYFDSDSFKVDSNSKIPPVLNLSSNADVNITTNLGDNIITTNSIVRPKLSTKGVSSIGTSIINSTEEEVLNDLVIEGNTIQDLVNYPYNLQNTTQLNCSVLEEVIDLKLGKDVNATAFRLKGMNIVPNEKYIVMLEILKNTTKTGTLAISDYLSSLNPEVREFSGKVGVHTYRCTAKPVLDGSTNAFGDVYICIMGEVGDLSTGIKFKISVFKESDYLASLPTKTFKGFKSVGDNGNLMLSKTSNLIYDGKELEGHSLATTATPIATNFILEPNIDYFTELILEDGTKPVVDIVALGFKSGNEVIINDYGNNFMNPNANFKVTNGGLVTSCVVYYNGSNNLTGTKIKSFRIYRTKDKSVLNSFKEIKSLGGIELRRLPNLESDTIQLGNNGWEISKRTSKYIFKGNENFVMTKADEVKTVFELNIKELGLKSGIDGEGNVLSNHNVISDNRWSTNLWESSKGMAVNFGNVKDSIQFILPKANYPTITTLDKFRELLFNKNLVLIYRVPTEVYPLAIGSTNNIINFEGQVHSKRLPEGAIDLVNLNLKANGVAIGYVNTGTTRLFKVVGISPANFNLSRLKGLVLNVANVTVPKETYVTIVDDVLPNSIIALRGLNGGVIGGGGELHIPVSNMTTAVTKSKYQDISPKVSLTGFDFNHLLEKSMYNILK